MNLPSPLRRHTLPMSRDTVNTVNLALKAQLWTHSVRTPEPTTQLFVQSKFERTLEQGRPRCIEDGHCFSHADAFAL